MKLAYNIWTTSRHSSERAVDNNSENNMNEPDASEPLLNGNQSSSLLTDYYAQTRAALPPGGITSRSFVGFCPSRTICSPQHPSQDLIEMLNRNQQVSLIRHEVQCKEKKKEAEAKLLEQQADLIDMHSLTVECTQLLEDNMQNQATDELKQASHSTTDINDTLSKECKQDTQDKTGTQTERRDHITMTDDMLIISTHTSGPTKETT